MTITIDAVYEGGVLKPAEPLPLSEHEKVSVTIESASGWVERTKGMLKWPGDPEELRRFLDAPDDGKFGSP
jgi:predicted DNA-binding antitoxin AbrB/MazE fold protein